jgi:hypothetical protein
MKLVVIHFITIIIGLFVIGFGAWSYGQASYHDKVRKAFVEKEVIAMQDLKKALALTDKIVLVEGLINSTETFISRNNKKVVLERYREEFKYQKSNKDWKDIKETSFFKVIPFYLKNNNNSILIDPFGVDKTFLGTAEEKIETVDDKIIKKSLWTYEIGKKVYVLGNLESKGDQLVLNNPNIYKSVFSGLFDKEPFIVTDLSKTEVANKASQLGKSIYFASLALFAAGGIAILSSIMNIFKNFNKTQLED